MLQIAVPSYCWQPLGIFFFPNKLAKFPLNNISEEFLLPVIPFERLLQSHTKLNEITDLQGFFFFPLLTRKIDVTYLL